MLERSQHTRKVWIRRYLARLFDCSGKTVQRRFGPRYRAEDVRSYLLEHGYKSKAE